MKEDFCDLVKEIDIQVQEAQRVPNKVRLTPGHILFTMQKVKDKENLKSRKRKPVPYKGAPIRPVS